MKYSCRYLTLVLAVALTTVACKKDEEDPGINDPIVNTAPEFFKETATSIHGSLQPTYTVVAGASDQIEHPNDLAFNPSRPNELWVINEDTEFSGGSTVKISNAGEASQTSLWQRDWNARHFMARPTGIAFSTEDNDFSPGNSNFATSAGVFSANLNTTPFTGPSLWSSDPLIYAQTSSFEHGLFPNGSHLDMLHETPYGMGIAHEVDNVFWLFDGFSGIIKRYDFVEDHGPGNDDHSDGIVRSYSDVTVTRNPDVPSHLILDKNTGWLYICDTGGKRVIRMDINSGSKNSDIPLLYEFLAERSEWTGATVEVFATGLEDPCGIALNENRLFVGDNSSGEIIAYDINSNEELARVQTPSSNLRGLEIGPNGKLWYVDYDSGDVVRIDPN